jgi:hypothetical protein
MHEGMSTRTRPPACPYCGRPLTLTADRWLPFECDRCGKFSDFASVPLTRRHPEQASGFYTHHRTMLEKSSQQYHLTSKALQVCALGILSTIALVAAPRLRSLLVRKRAMAAVPLIAEEARTVEEPEPTSQAIPKVKSIFRRKKLRRQTRPLVLNPGS